MYIYMYVVPKTYMYGSINKGKENTTWGLILNIIQNAWAVAIKVVQTEVKYDWPTSLLR